MSDQSFPFHDESTALANAPGAWLGRLLGGVYARWCTKQMANDAARHFNLLCIKESP